MKKYNRYEICEEEVKGGFESLIQLSINYSEDKDIFEDYVCYVNNEHDSVFYEILHTGADHEIYSYVICQDYSYRLLQRQKSIITLCNQQADINEIREKIKDLKDYLKKYYSRLDKKIVAQLKSNIKNYSKEVIDLNSLLIMKDLDERTNSNNWVDAHQGLLKSMKVGASFDPKGKKFKLDFSSLKRIKNKKKKR